MKKYLLVLSALFLLGACSSNYNVSPSDNSEEDVSEHSEEIESEATSEEESESQDSEVEGGHLSFNCTYVPSSSGTGYPDDQDIDVEGYTFAISNVQSTGSSTDKFPNSIQMKKNAGFFMNKTALPGSITIIVMVNHFTQYNQGVPTDVDATVCPAIYSATTLEGLGAATKVNLTQGTLNEAQGEMTYSLEGSQNRFYKFMNDTSYAIYLKEVSWSW